MANLILLGTDLSTYTLSATSTDPANPLVNLQSYYADMQWKSLSTSAQTLVIDFGSATSRNFILMDAHTINSHAAVALEAADNAGFSSGFVTPYSFTPPESDPILYRTFTPVSKRYWRINYSNPAGTAPYIGNLMIDTTMDFGYSYDFPYKALGRDFATKESVALDGRLRMTSPYAGRKMFEVKLSALNNTVKANFETFVAKVRGKLRPFYMLDYDTNLYLVHFAEDYLPMEAQRYGVNNTPLLKMKAQLVG